MKNQKLTKYILLLPALLLLTGCLSQGGSGSAAASPAARTIESPPASDSTPTISPITDDSSSDSSTTSTTTTTMTSIAPSFSLSNVQGTTYASANGSLTISATTVTDTYCGFSYDIESASSTNGIVTVVAKMNNSSQYTSPSHNDCLVPITTIAWYYNPNSCGSKIYFGSNYSDIAWGVTYTIEQISGGIAVTRELRSKAFQRSCTTPIQYTTESTTMNEENLF